MGEAGIALPYLQTARNVVCPGLLSHPILILVSRLMTKPYSTLGGSSTLAPRASHVRLRDVWSFHTDHIRFGLLVVQTMNSYEPSAMTSSEMSHSNHVTSSNRVDTLVCNTTMRRIVINFLYNSGHMTVWFFGSSSFQPGFVHNNLTSMDCGYKGLLRKHMSTML